MDNFDPNDLGTRVHCTELYSVYTNVLFNTFRDNCDVKAAKVFRFFAKRPYFFPAMAEVSKTNQLIVAKGNKQSEMFQVKEC